MSLAVRQMFPRREGGRIVHKEWTPDLGCAQRINRFGTRKAGRLVREVEEMAQHFPRWLLSVAIDRKLVRCAKCKGMLVFDRGLRCVECETARSVDRLSNRVRLAYFGLMPPIGIDGLRRVKKGLGSRAPRQHVVGRATEIGSYLLVPLVASFPNDYPNSPVAVAYLPGFFQIPGTPAEGPSHLMASLDPIRRR